MTTIHGSDDNYQPPIEDLNGEPMLKPTGGGEGGHTDNNNRVYRHKTLSQDNDEDEEDFFSVNHVGSIQVNDRLNNTNSAGRNHADPATRVEDGMMHHQQQPNDGSDAEHAQPSFKRFGDESRCSELLESDSEGEAFDPDDEIDEMDDIRTSPYVRGKGTKGQSAEKNEEPFVQLKRILNLPETSREAIEIFGGRDPAWVTLKSFELIEKSGMVYSQHWRLGLIHGENFGTIPNHILVLLLQPMRFIKASETDLSAIVKELDCHTMIQSVMDEWDLNRDRYPLIMSTDRIFHFIRKKRDCYRCVLFLARLASCCMYFGMPLMETCRKKAIACLDILESHIIDPGVKSVPSPTATTAGVGQEESVATATGTAFQDSSVATTLSNGLTTPVASGKKRGRPPGSRNTTKRFASAESSNKSETVSLANGDVKESLEKRRGRPSGSKKTKAVSSSSNDTILAGNTSRNTTAPSRIADERIETTAPNAIVTQQSTTNVRREFGSLSSGSPALQQLIGRFEEKYKEMGELLEQVRR